MPKWKNKSKEDKETIKKSYLDFYNNFNKRMCPYLRYKNKFGFDKAEGLFTTDGTDACSMCSEFKTLKVYDRYGSSCCPCIEHGSYDAKKLLKKLLISWKLIKLEKEEKKRG
jgi:hypothetical protein